MHRGQVGGQVAVELFTDADDLPQVRRRGQGRVGDQVPQHRRYAGQQGDPLAADGVQQRVGVQRPAGGAITRVAPATRAG
ncbi:hypothetical protein GCM10027614_08300 [Micromonospora vulcania]